MGSAKSMSVRTSTTPSTLSTEAASRPARRIVLALGAAWLAAAPVEAGGEDAVPLALPVAIADFDNFDTSGEAAESSAAHAARVAAFDTLLGDSLVRQGGYDLRPLPCPARPCTAGGMDAEELLRAARGTGARLLLYGGIHKMSTLVQWGKVQVVDLEADALLLDRSFSFRGDNDEAFARAAAFLTRDVDAIAPKP